VRRLNSCVLGPAALIVTAVVIAFTPMVGNAGEPDAAGARSATTDVTIAAEDSMCQISDAAIT
jgi:hypothetical protein